MYLSMNTADLRTIIDAIKPTHPEQAQQLEDASRAHDHDGTFSAAAREKYAGTGSDGDIDWDDETAVSASDEGAYVMAWLWVSNEEAGIPNAIHPRDSDMGEQEG